MVNFLNIRNRASFVLVFAAVSLAIGRSSPAQVVGKNEFSRTFRETEQRRDIVVQAAEWANSILGADVPFVLAPSWLPRPSTNKEVIPIYSGNPIAPSITRFAFVPDKERCIIVEEKEIPTLAEVWGNKPEGAANQPVERLLAIALLHESGHLFLRHGGCLDQRGDRLLRRIDKSIKSQNDENQNKNRVTADKRIESDADSFVVKALVAAKADKQDLNRWLKANNLEMTLGTVSLNLSFSRLLDNFGGQVVVTKESNKFYHDKNLNYPNMELRILRINAGLAPDSKYPQLVEEFEKRREAAELGILYQAPADEKRGDPKKTP